VIAHRLTAVKNMDQVAVLDNGVIVETGSYNFLIEKNGVFKNINDIFLKSASLDEG
jgi:ABC-type multidrug transport system fused ATPase/permease subunit